MNRLPGFEGAEPLVNPYHLLSLGDTLPADHFTPSTWARGDGPLAVTAYWGPGGTVREATAYEFTRTRVGAAWWLVAIG